MTPEKARSDYREVLLDEFVRRREGNSRYSLRAFARDLGISPASLSQALSAKRHLSPKSLLKCAESLCLSPNEVSHLLGKAAEATPKYTQLEEDIFCLMSDWFYFAILSLARLKKTRADAHWIAKKIGVSPVEARVAVERLVRLGFLKVVHGRLCCTATPLSTTNEVPSSALRKFHKQLLGLAAASIDKDSIEKRQAVSITMAINPDRLPEAKRLIIEFRDRLSVFLEQGVPQEVYTLAIQLFPMTRNWEEK